MKTQYLLLLFEWPLDRPDLMAEKNAIFFWLRTKTTGLVWMRNSHYPLYKGDLWRDIFNENALIGLKIIKPMSRTTNHSGARKLRPSTLTSSYPRVSASTFRVSLRYQWSADMKRANQPQRNDGFTARHLVQAFGGAAVDLRGVQLPQCWNRKRVADHIGTSVSLDKRRRMWVTPANGNFRKRQGSDQQTLSRFNSRDLSSSSFTQYLSKNPDR